MNRILFIAILLELFPVTRPNPHALAADTTVVNVLLRLEKKQAALPFLGAQ